MQVRRLDTSYDAASSTCSMPAYIVGTPSKTVTLSRPTTSSAFVGVEAGDQGQAGAGEHRGVEPAGQAEAVEQRQAAHHHVARA